MLRTPVWPLFGGRLLELVYKRMMIFKERKVWFALARRRQIHHPIIRLALPRTLRFASNAYTDNGVPVCVLASHDIREHSMQIGVRVCQFIPDCFKRRTGRERHFGLAP